ncbi:MAG: diguanylate cyclase [Treponema sp.]|jgi:diguanylate cyclase (GGDEF)-like protein|nr:diguanylate cyclase [Treponema sp.]
MADSGVQSVYDQSLIQKAELFSALLPSERDFIHSRSSILQLRKGERLFSPGEHAEHFYMLIEGSIHVVRPISGGGEDEMARFTVGDSIGDFDFARGGEYDAYAEAVTDCILVMFPGLGLTMDMFALEEPYTISRILLNSIVMMTSRIKATHQIIIENLSWVQELHRRAYEDPGTGLWKQSFLTDEINRILENPTALIMLKPDRFKTLVDSRGHNVGDEAMIRIALVLKSAIRRIGRGWPLRFKSNEVGILVNKCDSSLAETSARELFKAIAAMEPVPAQGDMPAFSFSATISYAVWPHDNTIWEDLLNENYALLLDTWRAGGNQIVHYTGREA